MYGRKFIGGHPQDFLIDSKGRVARVWRRFPWKVMRGSLGRCQGIVIPCNFPAESGAAQASLAAFNHIGLISRLVPVHRFVPRGRRERRCRPRPAATAEPLHCHYAQPPRAHPESAAACRATCSSAAATATRCNTAAARSASAGRDLDRGRDLGRDGDLVDRHRHLFSPSARTCSPAWSAAGATAIRL